MTSGAMVPRSLVIFGVCIPLALLLGYVMANPFSTRNIMLVGVVMMVITLPLWMRWHHELLLLSWNSMLVAFFLPGQQPFWVPAAFISLFFSVLNHTMDKEHEIVRVPSLTRPLLCLSAVLLVTALATGGLIGQALGSDLWGARRYFTTFGAVIGFYALMMVRLSPARAQLLVGLFVASTIVAAMSDLIYMLGPRFYILYHFFNPELAGLQASTQDYLNRLTGVSLAANALVLWMLVRHGAGGVLDVSHPIRLAAFWGLVALSMLGGFRSTVVLFIMIFGFLFYFEGLFRTRVFPALIMVGILGTVFLFAFSEHLPLSVQRSISFLPIRMDPKARIDAASTTDWRLQMWKAVWPEVPKHLLLGRGYAFSGTDYYLTQMAVAQEHLPAYESTLINGNYHNGWLTVLIPFGLPGLAAFLWFLVAGYKVLRANYRYGPENYRNLNTFLLAYYLSRSIFYLVAYGQFDLDLSTFTGTLALSISLNGGICRPGGSRESTLRPAAKPVIRPDRWLDPNIGLIRPRM